ncbi:MAG: permease component of ribose/xylose/arabinose/galactoside ABC-type transporter, partial [Phycisphaerales bacterium]|nr:permease component of ribose/xylose/arabinose/galactoside ABC-type transporter [Phycisphaerales bacterium]
MASHSSTLAGLRPFAVLGAVIALELLIFGLAGTNFFSFANAVEVLRLNVELGLIALALTPVIVSGGIDLSVGSMMALAAITFGKLQHDAGVPWPIAAALAIAVGVLGGALNGLAVARLKVPPLIVTLATFSLFRGIAEGITGGAVNYTNFPPAFLSIGQGAIGPWPMQATLLVIAAIAFYVLLHRTTVGRSIEAIGFAPDGARYAGLPVERRLTTVYVLSGLCAGIAAIVYVARVGQAKADAGTGYELSAITAVVLGGTSIFGGRGSIVGTLLGLLALALLENGLRLADGPPELAGILKGLLLLLAIAADQRRTRATKAPVASIESTEEFEMKNGQLAVLCVTILIAAGVIVLGNQMLIKNLRTEMSSPSNAGSGSPRA